MTDARAGLADIGLVSRALKPDESDLLAHTIALDGVGVIVHRSNPVGALKLEQLRALYTGQVRNWRELGGLDRAVTVVNQRGEVDFTALAQDRTDLDRYVRFVADRQCGGHDLPPAPRLPRW